MRAIPVLAFAAAVACGGSQPDTKLPPTGDGDGPPVAARKPAITSYHGVEVTEHYRWLEDWSDPAVREWTEAQNTYARAYLSGLPGFAAIRERVAEIEDAPSVFYGKLQLRDTGVFAMKYEPPTPVAFLVLMPSLDAPSEARVLADPTKLDPEGLTRIDWYEASPDGQLVAVSLSRMGTEEGDLYLFDVATGERVHEVIPRVNGGTAGGSMAWAPDGTGFFYTRYPREGERPAEDMPFYTQVYYHALGTPTEQDRYEIGKEFPKIGEIELTMDHGSGRLLATVQNGDGGEFALYLRDPQGAWKQFSTFGDRVVQAAFGRADDLYLLSFAAAPRGKILRTPIAALDLAGAETVVPQSDGAIPNTFWSDPSIVPTKSRLYVKVMLGGPSAIRAYDLQGNAVGAPEQYDVASVDGLAAVPGTDDGILFSQESYLHPAATFVFDPEAGTTTKTEVAIVPPVTLQNFEVRRELATSKDGTKVPLNIIMPKGIELNGSHPCLATGYGGYGISLEPQYRAYDAIAIEQGVVVVVANLRGGGEYGEEWHRQGNLTRKQNVFDDFAAVLQHLIDRGYTSSDRLAIVGGSNGGLLMGALLTQHPDLVKVVASFVGIYDMLRTELSPNGEFNITEYGTVKIEEQFEALYAYSPYHHVREGTRYPAVLLHAGSNDPRVSPWQSRKMTAALQHAQAGDAPILLRTDAESGHGGSTKKDVRIEQAAQFWAFLFDEIGVTYHKP